MLQTAAHCQYQASVTYLDDDSAAILMDHTNRRPTAWSLINDRWMDATVADTTHNGRICFWSPMEQLSDLPPLPEDLLTVVAA